LNRKRGQPDYPPTRKKEYMKEYAYEYWRRHEFEYAITVRAKTRKESLEKLMRKFSIDELLYIGTVK
jgi:hypothetical protein